MMMTCTWQTPGDATRAAQDYLRQNVMQFDLPFLSTMGFSEEATDNVDGLADGMIGPTIDLAFAAKHQFLYTDTLPRELFYEYVLNYANVNEGRTNWRPLLWKKLVQPLLLSEYRNNDNDNNPDLDAHYNNNNNSMENRPPALDSKNVVALFNEKMWTMLAPADADPVNGIVFHSGQAPAILDPMSTMMYGYGSCTGLSLLLVNALRTAGVPARMAGTPAWYGNRTAGNHNWVEVYSNETWYFLESSPAALSLDTLDRNPCQRWFCTPDRFPAMHGTDDTPTTKVYAARLDSSSSSTFFRLAWEWSNQDVPAEDRTQYYHEICSQCPPG